MKIFLNRKNSRSLLIIIGIALILLLSVALTIYFIAFFPNVRLKEGAIYYLKISTGTTYQDLDSILTKDSILKSYSTFRLMARQKNLPSHIYPGNYKIVAGMNNNRLINKLRSGSQDPVKLRFNSVNTLYDLAGIVSKQIEADSVELIHIFSNDSIIANYGFTKENFPAMFIPNTYNFFWNSSASGFLKRMNIEYNRFWNLTRKALAGKAGLTPVEVSILASIIEKETNKTDEMPRIAGLYINRLRKGMPLQADPTVKHALGDPTLKRILLKHLQVQSPYNTYLNQGLPPGPICIPSIQAIEAVLHFEENNFLYFCARDDHSGYHNFTASYSEHLRNRLLYQRSLDKKK